ncbi:hypothetical protein WOLCODRAFT_136474 [Wolfiporia cocos MD-104 SS10]|uniref:Ubiquitin-like protease family profile domain-containing protein n=1 Tax=Wolfiporia cocos (strain MD-104) TaxID=742152 RepID=A0A2H3JSV1_WOLCO|nr:hypothetical protein WOLCODRAFT_136474 [Wolfiporia cocos MD-104 SS10]
MSYAGRPTKRLKLDQQQNHAASVRTLHEDSQYFGSISSSNFRKPPPLLSTSSRAPIDLTGGNDEDVDEPYPRKTEYSRSREQSDSPDPIDCFADMRESHPFDDPKVPVYRRHAPAEDQPAIKRLAERVKPKSHLFPRTTEPTTVSDDGDNSDPIEESSPPPPSRPAFREGTAPPQDNVKQKINMFEQKQKPPETVPKMREIDLTAKSISLKKNSMKRRDGKEVLNASVQFDSFATKPSGFSASATNKKTSAATRKPPSSDAIALPLDAYSLGCRVYEAVEDDDTRPRFWLVCDTKSLSIRERSLGDDPSKGKSVHVLQLDRDIESFTRTLSPFKNDCPVILRLKPYQTAARTRGQGQFPDYKPGSKGLDGFITFRFDRQHANWVNGAPYENLVARLEQNKITPKETVDSHGAKALWEQTLQAQEMKQYEATRKKVHTPRKLELEFQVNESPSHDAISEHSGTRQTPQPAHQGISTGVQRETRTTRQSERLNIRSPTPEADELILVYPSTGAGAININNSDLKRLQPSSYLNDTLIEFGLKLWLADLKETNPSLAEQVHIFSSFFYKKLNVKNKEEAYKSVRKWTTKFDLFQKKYIIVPINEHFHWYLAIICNPGRILQPQPASILATPKPLTRKRMRESNAAHDSEPDEEVFAFAHPTSREEEIVPDSREQSCCPSVISEAEKEVQELLGPMQSATTEESDSEDLDLQYPDSSPPGSPMDVDETGPQAEDPSIPSVEEVVASSRATSVSVSRPGTDVMADVPASSFYGASSEPRSAKGKEKAVDIDAEVQDDAMEGTTTNEESTDSTYIFTFDSLGARHPQAVKILTRYLQLEAKDKKDLDDTGQVTGKAALVPSQPNYCDCGVYVLHFVRTFLRSPETYQQLIVSQKGKDYDREQRRHDWKDDEVEGLRQELTERIQELSQDWKRERASKEEQLKKDEAEDSSKSGATAAAIPVEDSDSDVIIEETVVTSRPSRSKLKPRSAAKR